MTCDEAEILLHALIDGELDASHAREVEEKVPSLADYIQHCRRTDEELRQYADRVEHKKWWQFWIAKP